MTEHHLRAGVAELEEAAREISTAHAVLVSVGVTSGAFKRHLEEPIYKLLALLAQTSRGGAERTLDPQTKASAGHASEGHVPNSGFESRDGSHPAETTPTYAEQAPAPRLANGIWLRECVAFNHQGSASPH